jgi:hypothetical protein
MFKGAFFALTMFITFAFQGCAGSTEFTIVDQREELGEVFTETTGTIDNTNGQTDLIQDIAARRQFRHTIDLRLNNSASLDRQEVEERILATYDLPSAAGEKLCLIPADVPPGGAYAYDLEWTQVLREGNIEEGASGGGDLLGTYTIVIDLQCQVIGVQVRR